MRSLLEKGFDLLAKRCRIKDRAQEFNYWIASFPDEDYLVVHYITRVTIHARVFRQALGFNGISDNFC
ncbi:hypothetical protein VL15_04640 [Burkholderia cepacia]|uniref:Uncharacterized protein n=1 Tax=Burkholderia cepacia TaxID=292 RepID=A0A0J6A7N0_BURCE|nr:hypothetical protein VL15_04640 [Burkholderia cepacia]